MSIVVRRAALADDPVLSQLDLAAWAEVSNVVPLAPPGRAFFTQGTRPDDVLVAELNNRLAGYLKLRPPTPLASNAHVQQIQGLAVDPRMQRQGVGRALIGGAIEEARRRGARKVSLRVLSSNRAAQRLYAACGFEVEGVLREEFLVHGRYVDDWQMARLLSWSDI